VQIGNRRLRRKELRSLLAGVKLLTHQICQKQSASHALRQLPGNSRSESGTLHKERPDGHSLLASGYWWYAGSEKAANSACAPLPAKSMNGRPLFASGRTIRHIPSLTRLIRKIFRPLKERIVPILPHAVKGLRFAPMNELRSPLTAAGSPQAYPDHRRNFLR
jgi:hypothetical protein